MGEDKLEKICEMLEKGSWIYGNAFGAEQILNGVIRIRHLKMQEWLKEKEEYNLKFTHDQDTTTSIDDMWYDAIIEVLEFINKSRIIGNKNHFNTLPNSNG